MTLSETKETSMHLSKIYRHGGVTIKMIFWKGNPSVSVLMRHKQMDVAPDITISPSHIGIAHFVHGYLLGSEMNELIDILKELNEAYKLWKDRILWYRGMPIDTEDFSIVYEGEEKKFKNLEKAKEFINQK